MHSESTSYHVLSCSQSVSGAISIIRLSLSLAIAILLASAGCGDSDEFNRVAVHGVVTLNGAPIKTGRVNFIPKKGTHGPASGSEISAGNFVIHRNRGPVPGKYLVRIQIDDVESVDNTSTETVVTSRPPTKEEVLAGKDELQPEESRPNAGTPNSQLAKSQQNTAPEFHVTVTVEGPNNFELAVGSEDARKRSVPQG
jgi:hypothetical protein